MLIDTNFAIDLLEGLSQARVLAEEVDRSGENLSIPAPTAFELWVGASQAVSSKSTRQRLEAFLSAYPVAEFRREDARAAGELQATLAKVGRTLGTVDAQLAGMGLARSETLLTADAKLLGLGHGLLVRAYRVR